MKVWHTLALFVGLSTAAPNLVQDSVVAEFPHRKVRRAQTYSGSTILSPAAIPEGAPSGYATATGHVTDLLDTSGLTELPSHLVDRDDRDAALQRREVLRKLRGVAAVNDFYECATSGNPPKASDCNTVITNVFAADQLLAVSPRACLLFQYGTCWGFFCSLCQQLSTDTDFIGNQLSTAQTLCVQGGSAGTVVGEGEPQWEAGFIRSGGSLPNYDVC